MYYLGAAGLFCSVRTSTSWRGLLSTVGFGYLGGAILFGVTLPIPLIFALIIKGILGLVDRLLNTQLAQMKVGGLSSYRAYSHHLLCERGSGADLLSDVEILSSWPAQLCLYRRPGTDAALAG